jgi:hypothetical protein
MLRGHRFGSGLDVLYVHGAGIVVTGHRHNYERFGPQTPAGAADSSYGIRQFVVGTGGAALGGFSTTMKNSQIRNSRTYGVLRLTLHASSYDFAFLPIAGQTFRDSGSTRCHGKPPASATAGAHAATTLRSAT